mmetsp:Transcript_63751/g.177284  ORF Transcript_63751/g.177284 Transcript_63751/m.177284 type:complete len:113 (+) Transcript_63751:58-396(+)
MARAANATEETLSALHGRQASNGTSGKRYRREIELALSVTCRGTQAPTKCPSIIQSSSRRCMTWGTLKKLRHQRGIRFDVRRKVVQKFDKPARPKPITSFRCIPWSEFRVAP